VAAAVLSLLEEKAPSLLLHWGGRQRAAAAVPGLLVFPMPPLHYAP
jgi:hypothetical protein